MFSDELDAVVEVLVAGDRTEARKQHAEKGAEGTVSTGRATFLEVIKTQVLSRSIPSERRNARPPVATQQHHTPPTCLVRASVLMPACPLMSRDIGMTVEP